MQGTDLSQFFRQADVARICGIKPANLSLLIKKGKGPPCTMAGPVRLFHPADVAAWKRHYLTHIKKKAPHAPN